MSPEKWRRVYKPALSRICKELKRYNKPLIYHTDGNYIKILDDLIEIGIDATHPNEAKSGIDIVNLKEKTGRQIAFFGNIDATIFANSKKEIEREIHHKLRSRQKDGGYIPGGDDVPPTFHRKITITI